MNTPLENEVAKRSAYYRISFALPPANRRSPRIFGDLLSSHTWTTAAVAVKGAAILGTAGIGSGQAKVRELFRELIEET